MARYYGPRMPLYDIPKTEAYWEARRTEVARQSDDDRREGLRQMWLIFGGSALLPLSILIMQLIGVGPR